MMVIAMNKARKILDPVDDRKSTDSVPWYFAWRSTLTLLPLIVAGLIYFLLIVVILFTTLSKLDSRWNNDWMPLLESQVQSWRELNVAFSERESQWLDSIAVDAVNKLEKAMVTAVSETRLRGNRFMRNSTMLGIVGIGFILLLCSIGMYYRESKNAPRVLLAMTVAAIILDQLARWLEEVMASRQWWSEFSQFAVILVVFGAGSACGIVVVAFSEKRMMCPWCAEVVRGTTRCLRCSMQISKLSDTVLIGNRRTRELHLGNCVYVNKMTTANRVEYESAEAAYWDGYNNCAHCLH